MCKDLVFMNIWKNKHMEAIQVSTRIFPGYFTYQNVRNDIFWFKNFKSMKALIYYQ